MILRAFEFSTVLLGGLSTLLAVWLAKTFVNRMIESQEDTAMLIALKNDSQVRERIRDVVHGK